MCPAQSNGLQRLLLGGLETPRNTLQPVSLSGQCHKEQLPPCEGIRTHRPSGHTTQAAEGRHTPARPRSRQHTDGAGWGGSNHSSTGAHTPGMLPGQLLSRPAHGPPRLPPSSSAEAHSVPLCSVEDLGESGTGYMGNDGRAVILCLQAGRRMRRSGKWKDSSPQHPPALTGTAWGHRVSAPPLETQAQGVGLGHCF